MLNLWTLFALASAANALQCYQYSALTCGKHDAIYNDVCDAYESSVTDPREITCEDKCGTVTVTESSHQYGDFEVNLVLLTCVSTTDGCRDEEELENLDPALREQIEAYETAGIITEKLELCTCGTDLCNSALSLADRSVYLLSIIIASLEVILLA